MAITQQDLADFHRVSKSAVKQWSKQKQREKKVQLVAGIDLEVSKLLGEISQLVYLYNCKNIEGIKQVKQANLELLGSMLVIESSAVRRRVHLDSDLALVSLRTVIELLKTEIY